MTTKADGFNEWCIVELLGHRRVAGLVSEASIGGSSLLRVDVPESPEHPAMTQYYGPGAIYCMTPTTEAQARAAARAFALLPVSRREVAPLPPRFFANVVAGALTLGVLISASATPPVRVLAVALLVRFFLRLIDDLRKKEP